MESDYMSTPPASNPTPNPTPTPTPNPPTNPSENTGTDPNLNPRIDVVEKEVKKLKTDVENVMDLKNTVDDLKNTIVDIRALMSETQNPFNLLQFITDEDELNKLIQARPLLEKKLLAKAGAKAEDKFEGKGAAGAEVARKEVGFVVESKVEDNKAEDVDGSVNLIDEGEKITEPTQPETSIEPCKTAEEAAISGSGKGISIIHWIYRMLDLGFDERSIRKICDFCEFSAYMPKGYSENVSNLVSAIIRARSQKISAEEFILSIYSAADAVGAKIDSKDLSELMIHVLRKNKMSGQ